jgi:hypothetical protein
MSESFGVRLDNGEVWYVNAVGFELQKADIIIPIDRLEGMTDEEIGKSVRALIPHALFCAAIAVAGEVLRLESYLKDPDIRERRAEIARYAAHSEVIREALDIIDGKRPHPHAIIRSRNKTVIPKRAGYIYLLKSDHGYKIGKTKRLPERIKHFDIKLPYPVELIHTITTDDMKRAETQLHERFAGARINGEWFNLKPDDVAYITALSVL